MATTLEALSTFYRNVARTGSAAIPAADQLALNSLVSRVESNQLPIGSEIFPYFEPASARGEVLKLVNGTTAVAVSTYSFFTGGTPSLAGLDYLVSPTGGNPNNLSSPYYQSFGFENRYINFAVNLGKLGEGRETFAADYGLLTLSQSVSKAYREIFGTTPSQAKVDQILDAQIPNGSGGTYSRADYFAAYGQDGPNGTGAKAAMAGWLLAEAVKAGTPVYAVGVSTIDAYIASGGQTYPQRSVLTYVGYGAVQPVLGYGPDDSVDANVPQGFIGGGGDLNPGRSIVAGYGVDRVTVTGVMRGLFDTVGGDDLLTIDTVAASVGLVGGVETGTVKLGWGDDRLIITGRLTYGAVIDGQSGDDTLTAVFGPKTSGPATIIRNIEHLVIAKIDPAATTIDLTAFTFRDVTLQANGAYSVLLGPQDDVIYIEAGAVSGGVTSITLGAGADVVRASRAGGLFNLHATDNVADGYVRITDFAKGVDRIDLAASASSVLNLTSRIGPVVRLDDAMANAVTGLDRGQTGVFEFGGDTFIYRQDQAFGVTSGDGLIRIVGVTGLSVGTGAAPADIHYG